ncbi:MAG: hypothetical protein C4519_26985 [Desulfobacteraceae bacterium]|nr:MAG: hypothetical protein C4519_26985 [Desulfobacteraceae bacterium]
MEVQCGDAALDPIETQNLKSWPFRLTGACLLLRYHGMKFLLYRKQSKPSQAEAPNLRLVADAGANVCTLNVT